ncbi:MAG: hypothetical protein A3F11_00440 [Gammaproteobacteria bacterium RIFCSPHIGHO2_12_FULL_37_14]|nr:MAG: hypothetical protein A3F11_00440 [Gammaproteobacteria bacterium RIFCSPHIGHO2_12_FULL_37_14]
MSADKHRPSPKEMNAEIRKKRSLKAPLIDEEGDSTESGGGQGGHIEFHDFITSKDQSRDDSLPSAEKQHSLAVHKDVHELRVKQQKELLEQRHALKEGKINLNSFRQGLMNAGMSSQFKPNPKLADKAQFSGIDKQVIGLPSESNVTTNENKQDELKLQLQQQLQLRHTHDNTPRLTPKNYR